MTRNLYTFQHSSVCLKMLRLRLRLGLRFRFPPENNTASWHASCVIAWITQLICQLAVLFLVVPQANVIVYKKHDTARLLTSCVIFTITQLACKQAVLFCRKLTQTQTQSQTQSEANRSHHSSPVKVPAVVVLLLFI